MEKDKMPGLSRFEEGRALNDVEALERVLHQNLRRPGTGERLGVYYGAPETVREARDLLQGKGLDTRMTELSPHRQILVVYEH